MKKIYLKTSFNYDYGRRSFTNTTQKRFKCFCIFLIINLLTHSALFSFSKPSHLNNLKTNDLFNSGRNKQSKGSHQDISHSTFSHTAFAASGPDLKLTYSILTSAPYVDGTNITIRFTAQNIGTAYAYVTDAIPNVLPTGLQYISHTIPGSGGFSSNTWSPNWGNFSSGGTYTIDVTARINSSSNISHTVTINGGGVDVDLSNNSTTLNIAVQSNSRPVVNNITSNKVMNNGSTKAITALNGTDADGTIASYTLVTLPNSWNGTLYVNGVAATVGQKITPSEATKLSYKAATGQVGTHTFTYSAEDNWGASSATSATYSIPVITGPDLVLSYKILTPGPYSTGQQIVLQYTVKNDGTMSISGQTEVQDLLPSTLSYVSHTGGTYDAATDTWNPSIYNLNYNTSTTLDLTATITGAVPLKHSITVNAPSSVTDVDLTNNTITYGVLNGTSVFNLITEVDITPAGTQSLAQLEGLSPTGNIISYTILSLPGSTYGQLYVGGVLATANQVITPSQAATLSFARDPDFISGTTMFTYTATDEFGNTASQPANYRLNIPPDETEMSPLAVSLQSFQVLLKNNMVHLTWQTAQETGNAYFEVERSSDAKQYLPIAKVIGASNSKTPISYQFKDIEAPEGLLYYRLKIVDIFGEFEYSKTAFLDVSKANKNAAVFLYPTQASQSVTLDLKSLPTGYYTVHIINSAGREVHKMSADNKHPKTLIMLDIERLSAGRYFVVVAGQSFSETLPLLKN